MRLNFTSIFQPGNIEVNGCNMKKRFVLTLVTAVTFGFSINSAPQSYAITASESGSSSSTNDSSSLAQSIGSAIERVASTVSQIVSPQPADSAAAQKAYDPIPALVCQISIAYVMTYTPVINWTYQNNRLIPVTTALIVSTPIESRICS